MANDTRRSVRLTERQRELIGSMIAIATANPMGEGDYESWRESDYDELEAIQHAIAAAEKPKGRKTT